MPAQDSHKKFHVIVGPQGKVKLLVFGGFDFFYFAFAIL